MKSDLFMVLSSLKDPKRLDVLPTNRSEKELQIGSDNFYMKRIGENKYRLYSKNMVLLEVDSEYIVPCPECGKLMEQIALPTDCFSLGVYMCMNCRGTAKK